MAYKFKNTIEELNYIVTGTEHPVLLSEREHAIIDKCAKHLEAVRENHKLEIEALKSKNI